MVKGKDGQTLKYEVSIVEVDPKTGKVLEHYVSHIPLFDDEIAMGKWAIENKGQLARC